MLGESISNEFMPDVACQTFGHDVSEAYMCCIIPAERSLPLYAVSHNAMVIEIQLINVC